MKLCRIVSKVIETQEVVYGSYVFTQAEAAKWVSYLSDQTGQHPVVRWVECITQAVS
jgi:hypothetical protein